MTRRAYSHLTMGVGERWHVLTVIIDVEKGLLGDEEAGGALIKLRLEEHEDSMWAIEE